MSTSIHHGYRLRCKTLKDVFRWKRKIQDAFLEFAIKRLRQDIFDDAIGRIDCDITWSVLKGIRKGYKRPLHHASKDAFDLSRQNALVLASDENMEEMKEHEDSWKTHRSRYRLEVTIQMSGDMVLCLLHNSDYQIVEWFQQNSGAEHFPYWDSCDQPKGMTRKEWKRRGRIWDRALNCDTPVLAGMSIKTEDPIRLRWTIREGMPEVPSVRQRAKEQAENWLLRNYFDAANPGASIMSGARKLRESQYRVESLAKVIAPHLPQFNSWQSLTRYRLRIALPAEDKN